VAAGWITDAAIALLFFMHGARLSPEAALLGARQWRLHAMVFQRAGGSQPTGGVLETRHAGACLKAQVSSPA